MIIISAVAQFVVPRIMCFALVLRLVCRKIKPARQPRNEPRGLWCWGRLLLLLKDWVALQVEQGESRPHNPGQTQLGHPAV